MAARDAELLIVQSSGPVKRYKWRPRWFAFLVILMIVLLAGAAVGGYFLYLQQRTIKDLSQQTAHLNKTDSALRAQVHELQTKLALAQASSADPEPAEPAEPTKQPQAKPEPAKAAAAKPETTTPATLAAAKPEPAPVETKAEVKPETKPESKPETARESATGTEPEKKPAEAQQQAAKEEPSEEKKPENEKELLPAEPTKSDEVDVRIVRRSVRGGTLTLVYDVVNQKNEGTAEGYVTVVVRGSRDNKPWIEASPPMRLSPLGRPLNYRRGTAYSVQRYRRLKATFPVADKNFERLEMLLYSRAGDLLMVKIIDLTEKKGAVEFGPRYVKG